MEWLSAWTIWHWIVLACILLIGEVIIPGIFLLWWGLAAFVVAIVTAIFPHLSLSSLFITYALLAIGLSIIWWRYQHKKDNQDQAKTSLNQPDHRMLGKIGIVQDIHANGIGRGHFSDTTWRIKGDQLCQGDTIEVVKVEGITLYVRKVISN